MLDFLSVVFREGVLSSVFSIARICLVLIPVIVLIEVAREYKILEVVSGKIEPLMRHLTLPKEAALPLLAALLFGIVLGSAVIIDYSQEGYLKKRDLLLVGVFMSISHSLLEDTFLFASVGANIFVLLSLRFILAIIITRMAASFLDYRHVGREKKAGAGQGVRQTP